MFIQLEKYSTAELDLSGLEIFEIGSSASRVWMVDSLACSLPPLVQVSAGSGMPVSSLGALGLSTITGTLASLLIWGIFLINDQWRVVRFPLLVLISYDKILLSRANLTLVISPGMFHFFDTWSCSKICSSIAKDSLHPPAGLLTLRSRTSALFLMASCHTKVLLNELGIKLITLLPRKRSTALHWPSGCTCEFTHNMNSSNWSLFKCLFFWRMSLQLRTNLSACEFDCGL